MRTGILAGLLAGALWGLTFIAPLTASAPLDLMLLRYLVFGLGSLAALAPGRFALLRTLTGRDLLRFTLLGAAGNVAYYSAMALAVPRIGSAAVALIIGCVPIVVGLLGHRGLIAPHRLVVPLVVVLLGLVLVNSAVFELRSDLRTAMDGFALAILALGIWCWYGMANARAIAARPHFNDREWTGLTGLGTLFALLPVIPLRLALLPIRDLHEAPTLLLWGLALGVLSSWCATWAWSIASRRLPVSLAAQLIVAETLFALLYSAIYERQLPDTAQLVGAICMLAGVVSAIRVFANNHKTL